MAENTLSWWQWRLRRGKAAMRRKPASTAPLFVEVPTDPVIAATANAVTAWDVELDLGGGMMLRLRRAPC